MTKSDKKFEEPVIKTVNEYPYNEKEANVELHKWSGLTLPTIEKISKLSADDDDGNAKLNTTLLQYSLLQGLINRNLEVLNEKLGSNSKTAKKSFQL